MIKVLEKCDCIEIYLNLIDPGIPDFRINKNVGEDRSIEIDFEDHDDPFRISVNDEIIFQSSVNNVVFVSEVGLQ